MEIKKNFLGVFYVVFFIGYLLLQFPFLNADADVALAKGSRGAWTDEGLYTATVRNFINQGYTDFIKEESILKTPYAIVTPLYSVFLYPFFFLFGISLVKARLITLLFCTTLLCFLCYKKNLRSMGLAFLLSTMMLHPIHQYTHLCLAEMYATLLIFSAIVVYVFYTDLNTIKGIAGMYLLIVAAILFKVQFIYMLPLPLLVSVLQVFSKECVNFKKQFLFSISALIIIALGLILLWYLPFTEAWKLTASNSSGSIKLEKIKMKIINFQVFKMIP